jgi:hypothetical protein
LYIEPSTITSLSLASSSPLPCHYPVQRWKYNSSGHRKMLFLLLCDTKIRYRNWFFKN